MRPGAPWCEGVGYLTVRRAVFYLFYDEQGVVDDYIPYMLSALRDHADSIFVVSNSPLTPEGRSSLEAVADTVYVRENVGFDVWAYREALSVFGWDCLGEFDEIILMNYTVYGPVFPFGEMFSRAEASDCDFWGVTAHKSVDPNPFPVSEPAVLPLHIQSHWIAVRRRMFESVEFRRYWDEMPMIESYVDSIIKHESRFTSHFAACGYRFEVMFPPERYPDDHPIFENFDLLLDDRCPIVKRRIFFHESTYLERHAIIAKRLMQQLETETQYPTDLIWRNVVRTVEPRTLYTNLSMLEVLPDHDDGYRPDPSRRVAVLAHMYYDDMVDEVMSYLSRIPVGYDLFVSTSTAERKAAIETALGRYGLGQAEVRVTAQNRGRDMSSLFITFRDVLLSGRYDYMCRVHSKKSPQNEHNNGRLFKQHMYDNLLFAPGYIANILRLFEEHPTLGMVFPPVVQIGFPTLGHSWFTNREPAEELAEELGIETRFDRSTPLAPNGTMYWFRPDALRDFTAREWDWTDYSAEPGHTDGGLAHVQERLLAYAAMNAGYHVRTVMNRDWAGINYTFLEYKYQRVAAFLPGYNQEQVDRLQQLADTTVLGSLKVGVRDRFPRLARVLGVPYRGARSAYRRLRPGARP